MDDIQDMKNALKEANLLGKINALKFIDIFSPMLSRYPDIQNKISNGEVELPLVVLGSEVISQGNIDIHKVVNKVQSK
jgi:disulfide oxidoreductase YuzD